MRVHFRIHGDVAPSMWQRSLCANDVPGDNFNSFFFGKGDRRAHWIRITHYRTHTSAIYRFHFVPHSPGSCWVCVCVRAGFFSTQKGTRARTTTRLPNANLNGVLHIGNDCTNGERVRYSRSIRCVQYCIDPSHSLTQSAVFFFLYFIPDGSFAHVACVAVFFRSYSSKNVCIFPSFAGRRRRNAFVRAAYVLRLPLVCDLVAAVPLHNWKLRLRQKYIVCAPNSVGTMKKERRIRCREKPLDS